MTEPSAALAELTDISIQIEAAVLFDADGKVVAATIPEERTHGGNRMAERDRRSLRRNAVLEQIADVEQARRDECDHQRERDLHRPSASLEGS